MITSSNNLTFDPGERIQNIEIGIVGETFYEDAETFTIKLSNQSSNATIADVAKMTGVTVSIPNDDDPPSIHYF